MANSKLSVEFTGEALQELDELQHYVHLTTRVDTN
jgi:hypothetical protein